MSDQIDPTERLHRLGTDLQAGPLPLTAADVRRRGDHLRRRSTAIRSGVAAVALAAVVLPLALLGHHDRDDTHVADPVGTGPGPTTRIPDGFPLDAGWPLDSAEGPDSVLAPSRTRKVDELTACGRTLRWPAHVDRMTAGFHNPEDGRDRTLTTYADADAAAAATHAIVSLFQGCTSEPGQPAGYVHHYAVSRTTLSGDSWLISNWYTYRGAPALGLTDIAVVRVGLGVLVMSQSNEGSKQTIPQNVEAMTTQAAEPLAAMCAFTEAGC